MRRLSSSKTFFYKRVLPICWFAFLALVTCMAIPEVAAGRVPVFELLIPVGMMAFGYFLMRALLFDLVDEVLFDGKEFVVRNGGVEDRFDLSAVVNVDFSEMTNPERITLTLREPRVFGKRVTFIPPNRWWRFGWHPLAKELLTIVRPKDFGAQDRSAIP